MGKQLSVYLTDEAAAKLEEMDKARTSLLHVQASLSQTLSGFIATWGDDHLRHLSEVQASLNKYKGVAVQVEGGSDG